MGHQQEVENERAGFDAMDCNLAGGNGQEEDWWNAEWPTSWESTHPEIDGDHAGKGTGDGKGKGKGKGMHFGGKGMMSPMQMMITTINAMKGGGTRFNNNSKGGIKGGGTVGKESGGKGCYN